MMHQAQSQTFLLIQQASSANQAEAHHGTARKPGAEIFSAGLLLQSYLPGA